jgi:hypothetical protein
MSNKEMLVNVSFVMLVIFALTVLFVLQGAFARHRDMDYVPEAYAAQASGAKVAINEG